MHFYKMYKQNIKIYHSSIQMPKLKILLFATKYTLDMVVIPWKNTIQVLKITYNGNGNGNDTVKHENKTYMINLNIEHINKKTML